MHFKATYQIFSMSTGKILILSSGVALGVYVPPLIINNQLRSRGINTDFYVIENLIQNSKISNILKNKIAFHRNFKLALIGQKYSKMSNYGLDDEKVSLLFLNWDKFEIVKILVFSGFWLPVVEKYLETRNDKDQIVDFCHLDSSVSTSWSGYQSFKIPYRDIWYFNLKQTKVNYYLKICDKMTVDFKIRDKRFVIHGGGWGMGTYKEKILELRKHRVNLDIINYEKNDFNFEIEGSRNFLIDSNWKTWEKYNGEYIFPPFCQVMDNKANKFIYSNEFPSIYTLISEGIGIISKPGGATLIDSFSSATPIIFLEPFGEYEKANAKLWIELGFGIEYSKWIYMNCSTDIFLEMHENIKKIQSYTENFINLYV
jgi:hypothetical protein